MFTTLTSFKVMTYDDALLAIASIWEAVRHHLSYAYAQRLVFNLTAGYRI